MTATASHPTLPDHPYLGQIDEAQVKWVGLGTGFEGLDVRPIYIDVGDGDVYFVLRATAAESPSAKPGSGKKARPFWLNRLKVESMAPIDEKTAKQALATYAAAIEKAKSAMDGQPTLEEAAAEQAEELDKTGTPAEVAEAAKDRVTGQTE